MPSESRDLLATTRKGEGAPSRRPRASVPCLTILCHPDPRRIGERALLSGLFAGRKVPVSRSEPSFAHPDNSSSARPLEDPYLSRKPIYLGPARPAGGVTIDAGSAEVSVQGLPPDRARVFAREELAFGVVLIFGDRLVLLLHETHNPAICPIDGVAGCSDAIALVRQEVTRVAATDVPVLVRGETGTGKECVARAIHEVSGRAKHGWIAVNMAALAESIAVSTLFGHAKGAFTGAQQRHRGVFEQASRGTLFLDEIGETPEKVQPMLLRALETSKILPLGEEVERAVDVRVITATDADLERDVAGGSFRAALFHRLLGYEIRVPPLRERRDDIARLFIHFLAMELTSTGAGDWLTCGDASAEPRVPVEVVARLVNHPLPGNVRQLRNAARHLAVGSQGGNHLMTTPAFDRLLSAQPAAPGIGPAAPTSSSPPPSRRPSEINDRDLLAVLEHCGWSPDRAASHFGLARSTLHDLMRRHGIRRAADVPDRELRDAHHRHHGDIARMAAELRVSARALRLTLQHREPGLDKKG